MSAILEFAEELKLVDKLVRRLDRAFVKDVWAYDHEREAKDREDAAAVANAQEYLRFNTLDSFRDRVRDAHGRALKRKGAM